MGSRSGPGWARGAIAGMAVLALGLAGCGAGGESVTNDTTPGVDSTNKVVSLGGWRIASGSFASQNQASQAVEACLNAASDAGGVNGWSFKYEARDTGGDPTRALQEVRNLVGSGQVFALLWGPGTPSNTAVLPYVEQVGVPYFPGMSGDAFIGKITPTVFSAIPPYSYMSMRAAQYAIDGLGAKRIALLYQDDDLGQSTHRSLRDYVASRGAELVADVPNNAADTDFAAMANVIARSQPDAVIQIGAPTALVKGKAATRAAGVDVPWLGPFFSATDDVVKLDPTTMDGTYFTSYTTPFFDSGNPALEAYRTAMGKYFPATAPSGYPLLGWGACEIFKAAFQSMTAGGAAPTREGLVAALEGLDGTAAGVIPSIAFPKGEPHTGPTAAYVTQWKGGSWAVVDASKPLPQGPQ